MNLIRTKISKSNAEKIDRLIPPLKIQNVYLNVIIELLIIVWCQFLYVYYYSNRKNNLPRRLYKQKNNKVSNQNRIDLFNSIFTAYKNREPLNRFVTINLELICPHKPKAALSLFLDNYKKFCYTRDINPAYIWLLENNNGDNLHAHILLSIPPNQDVRWINHFKKKVKNNWLEKASLLVTKEPNWFDCKTINYGIFYNHTLLKEVLSKLNSMYANCNKLPNDFAKKVNSIYQGRHELNYQFYHIVNIAVYLLKGAQINTQGLVSGRRFGRSHNLVSGIMPLI